MRIRDWSSDVCSSDLTHRSQRGLRNRALQAILDCPDTDHQRERGGGERWLPILGDAPDRRNVVGPHAKRTYAIGLVPAVLQPQIGGPVAVGFGKPAVEGCLILLGPIAILTADDPLGCRNVGLVGAEPQSGR